MKISLQNAGKRFNREWIFRNLNYEFISGKSYAITGPNGSGKSTLLQLIAGAITISEGTILYSDCKSENVYKSISIAAPYLELIEEMTLHEFLLFHGKLKKWLSDVDEKKIISILNFEKDAEKQIRYFSSGMKQRVKLAQSIFSDVPVILLDEPCTNLDEEGINLYKRLIADYCNERLLIISSNDKIEYEFCQEILNMKDIKSNLSSAGY